jgi:ribose/xylose/arabinose/galactoside ABC-type transport system permease subunit
VSIFGGAGTMLHTVAGLLLLGAVNNLLVLAGQPYEIHRIATGAILVAAIALDAWRRRGKR